MKKILMLVALLVSLHASSDYDKDIIVLDQSRDDKVTIVFSELMQNYEEEDSHAFFELISEERFIQDYMTFSEAIDEDFRKYEIITVDSWIDKITSDGVKRFLYVKWEKRYETNDGRTQLTQTGYSRFLFDEINGDYKLIELAGNHLWGNSLADWKEEVPRIAGQEPDPISTAISDGGLPDLTVVSVCPSGFGGAMPITITVTNNGDTATTSGSIYYGGSAFFSSFEHVGNLSPGESFVENKTGDCYNGNTVIVDPDDYIEEDDEDNNTSTFSGL